MDRSFLSDESVVAASRKFVCMRLLTYESAEEATILKSFFIGRSGQLENTTFALVAPDGKTKLSRAGRSPDFAFQGGAGKTPAQEMAESMAEIASRYEKTSTASASEASPLPLTKTVRLALDVAACDGLPLVVVSCDDAAKRAALTERLAALAWSAPFVGRFVHVVAATSDELKPVDGAKPGLLVVEPDEFGTKGTILAQAAVDADAAKLTAALSDGLAKHHATAKDSRTHIEQGRRLGIRWTTVIPETDPGPPGGGPPPGGR
jgi:hypothetical protein